MCMFLLAASVLLLGAGAFLAPDLAPLHRPSSAISHTSLSCASTCCRQGTSWSSPALLAIHPTDIAGSWQRPSPCYSVVAVCHHAQTTRRTYMANFLLDRVCANQTGASYRSID